MGHRQALTWTTCQIGGFPHCRHIVSLGELVNLRIKAILIDAVRELLKSVLSVVCGGNRDATTVLDCQLFFSDELR